MASEWDSVSGKDAPDVSGARVFSVAGLESAGRWHVLSGGVVWHEVAPGRFHKALMSESDLAENPEIGEVHGA